MRRKTAKGVVSSAKISTPEDKEKKAKQILAQMSSEEAKKESCPKSEDKTTSKRKRPTSADVLDSYLGQSPAKRKS